MCFWVSEAVSSFRPRSAREKVVWGELDMLGVLDVVELVGVVRWEGLWGSHVYG